MDITHNMSDELNEHGQSRLKRIRTSPEYEIKIEYDDMLTSENDENYDFSDSGGEDMAEALSISANDSESSEDDIDLEDNTTGSIQHTLTQYNIANSDVGDSDVRWIDEETDMNNFNFTKQNKLLVPIPGEGTPLDYFFLLFDECFIQLLVDETNSSAEEEFLRIGSAPKSRMSEWKPTDKGEILNFLALIIHTGTIKVNRLSDYWKKHHLFKMSCFSNYMSRDRFLILLRCFHFAPNISSHDQEQLSDRLYRVRPLINYFNDKMNSIYYPKKELTLDDSMVLWRGRLIYRQHIQNECPKYGLKLYTLTEPSGLMIKFAIYTEVFDDIEGKSHASDVVMNLMAEKLNNGHALYMDNFYNSFDLATKLIQQNTYCTGTLRLDRKNTPKEIKQAKLMKGETVARYSQGVVIGKWKDKREVAYISTEFKNKMVVSTNRKGQENIQPEPIMHYNRYMNGIDDRQHKMLSYYPLGEKKVRWYKKIYYT